MESSNGWQLTLGIAVVAGLVWLLVATSRRLGHPRLHMPLVAAVWVAAVLLAAVVAWLAFAT